MKYSYAFEKLAVWDLARKFVVNVYLHTKSFPKEELFGMTGQIRRAAVSICCNLAEGSARVHQNDQGRFYEIAYGSAVEVVNLLIISFELRYIQDETYEELRADLEKITYMINQLGIKKPVRS